MPDKVELMKSTLRNTRPFPDSGMPLLKEIVIQEMNSANASVDVAGFALSGDHVLEVVSALNGLYSLDISCVAGVTGDTVRHILKSSIQLKRLVILGCDAVTDGDFKDMLISEPKLFYNLHALNHPSFYSGEASYPNAFSYISLELGSVVSCSLAYFSPTAIVQGLTDLLRVFPDHYAGTAHGFLAPQSAFSTTPRNPEEKWGERNVICHPPPSLNALKGEGWAFVISSTMPILASIPNIKRMPNIWGFVRKRPQKDGATAWSVKCSASGSLSPHHFEVHNLRSFLARLEEEGRPAVTEEVVLKAEKVLRTMEKVMGVRLAMEWDLAQFIREVDVCSSRGVYNA
jgi:hypothetical protein